MREVLMSESNLETTQIEMIARDLGIKPEQITSEFNRRMLAKMERDPQFQFDNSSRFLRDPKIRSMNSEKNKLWNKKCQDWAQEIKEELEKERPA